MNRILSQKAKAVLRRYSIVEKAEERLNGSPLRQTSYDKISPTFPISIFLLSPRNRFKKVEDSINRYRKGAVLPDLAKFRHFGQNLN